MSEALADLAVALKRVGVELKEAVGAPDVYAEGNAVVIQSDKPVKVTLREASATRVIFAVRYAHDRRPVTMYWTCHGRDAKGVILSVDYMSSTIAEMAQKRVVNPPPRNGSYGHEHPRHHRPLPQSGGRPQASHGAYQPRVNGHDVLRGQGGR